jgi:DNA polymerase I
MGCHRAIGWPMPERILDLFTEFRDLTNGLRDVDGKFQKASLIDALAYFGLGHIAPAEKAESETDVIALANLLPKMLLQDL